MTVEEYHSLDGQTRVRLRVYNASTGALPAPNIELAETENTQGLVTWTVLLTPQDRIEIVHKHQEEGRPVPQSNAADFLSKYSLDSDGLRALWEMPKFSHLLGNIQTGSSTYQPPKEVKHEQVQGQTNQEDITGITDITDTAGE